MVQSYLRATDMLTVPASDLPRDWAGQASAGAGRLKEGVVSLKKKERGSRGIEQSPDQ